jgi:outer membrane lipoprotein LolB
MRQLLALVAALLVGACAQLGTKAPHDTEFDLTARLAARYGNDGFTGNLAWRHARTSDEILITNALGAGVAHIAREGDTVVLKTADLREFRASDPEALTEEALGFRLPIGGLADWVRARPSDPNTARVEYGDGGRVKTIQERGWNIEYQEYDEKLPKRIRLTYPNIELRLVISQWN